MPYSDYIVYVDESGDHSLTSIDPQYPMFVLAFCVFHKQEYANQAVPALQEFKFRFFGHDMVVLHEREIRKQLPPFNFLVNRENRNEFQSALGILVENAPFTLISVAISKLQLSNRYVTPENPYSMAVKYGLERLKLFLDGQEDNQGEKTTHVIFESRGSKEDDQLELEFRRVCAGVNYNGLELPFKVIFASKKTNSSGLQLADLVARPIGRHVLDPNQDNRAYAVLEQKFYRSSRGNIQGCGLKVFP